MNNTSENSREKLVVNDLKEFVELVTCFLFKSVNAPRPNVLGKIDMDIREMIWRGQLIGESLVPSAFRIGAQREEASMRAHKFMNAAPAIYGQCPSKDEPLKWLTLMQHHGLPTCLLDWSDSPLVALFFALDRNNDGQKHTDSVVWGLNPDLLNINYRPNGFFIQRPDSKDVAGMAKRFLKGNMPRPALPTASSLFAIALSAQYLDYQQMAQQSRYTIHEKDIPLETAMAREPKILPIQIVIPAECRETMRIHLLEMGIRRHHLFPNLRGLAKGVQEEITWWRGKSLVL